MCEVTGGFIMLLPSRGTHQGQEHLNKGERLSWKQLVVSFIASLSDQLIDGRCKHAQIAHFLVVFWTKIKPFRVHEGTEWTDCKNTYLLILACDLLPSPTTAFS